MSDRMFDLLMEKNDEAVALRAQLAAVTAERDKLQAGKERYEKCFVRIVKSYGIIISLILVGMAKTTTRPTPKY